jgi:hypothetical protein
MSDSTGTPATSNRTLLILLVAIVVLLLAIVVIFVVKGNASTSVTGTQTETPGATQLGAPPGMPGATAPDVEFDPATATKVPAGETPEAYVTAYFDAILAGDFATAYDRLPADKKAASTEEQFAEQLTGYGVAEYTIDDASEDGGEAQVFATAGMAGAQIQYLWTFVADGDGWLVKSRTLPGMGQ